MRTHVYFLVYRRRAGHRIRFDRPTGGLVMEAKRAFNGKPVSDLRLADAVAHQRYHCRPDEELILAEVFERKDCREARKLFRAYESEMAEFRELMGTP